MDAFDIPQKKIDWACTCLDRGIEAFRVYMQRKPFALVTEMDKDTGEKVVKIRQTIPFPEDVEGLFGNAMVDLKHSFDMSLYAAARTSGAQGFDRNYPWADSQDGLEKILKKRQAQPKQRLPDPIIEEIRRQKPYSSAPNSSSGNDLIRELAQMANDKHTIGFDAVPEITDMAFKNVSFEHFGPGGPWSFGHWCDWDPVKKELEIGRGSGTKMITDAAEIKVGILFERAGPIGENSAPVLIRRFAERARFVLEGFKRVSS